MLGLRQLVFQQAEVHRRTIGKYSTAEMLSGTEQQYVAIQADSMCHPLISEKKMLTNEHGH